MLPPQETVTAVVSGCALIALGVVPGLFEALHEGVRNALETFSSPFPARGWPRASEAKHSRPLWLAVAGLALLAIGLFAAGPN